jgi:uncharacterized Fe-S cluster protein YjdI
MDKKEVTKHYTNGETTVVWQSHMCTHSGNCVKNLKPVFNPGQSPWIQMDKGTTQEIKETVSKCPSGALSLL